MLRLAYRNLRTRPARSILTALAIAFGVAMILAMRIVTVAAEQANGDVRRNQLAGADLEVSSATGAFLRADLAAEIAARPEVAAAAPVYRRPEGATTTTTEQPALIGGHILTGTGLLLLGVDPAHLLTPYELAAGSFFSAPDAAEVLLPQSWAQLHQVRVNTHLTLTTGTQARSYTVVGLLEAGPEEGLLGRPTAWLPLETMQAGFETSGTASSILVQLRPGVLPEPARDQLRADLSTLYVVTSATGNAAGGIQSPMLMIVDAALPFAGVAVILAGAFLVYNAFAITLSERQREIGQLRILGMTRGQILRLVLGEALLVALLGSAVGLLLGTLLGRGMIVVFVGFVQGLPIPKPSWPLDGALLAVGAGVLSTLTVTLNLARRAGQVSPLEALRSSAQDEAGQNWYVRWGWVVAVGLLAFYFVVNALVEQDMRQTSSLDMLGVWFFPPFILAGVGLFALPAGVQSMRWLLGKIAPRLRVVPRLAAANLGRQQARAMLTAATLAIGLMLVTAMAGMTLIMQAFFRDNLLVLFEADFLLVPSMPSNSYASAVSLPSLPPLPSAAQSELDAIAEDADVGYIANIQLPGYGSGPALDNGWALTLDIVRDSPAFRPREGSWEEAERIFAQGLALSLPEIPARRLDLHPGDVVEIDTFEGRFPFQVAMIGGPLPLVTSEVGRAYFHSHPLLILVNARQAEDRAALEDRLRELARTYNLSFTPDMRTDFAGVVNQLFDVVLALFASLTSITGLVAGLSVINTQVAAVLSRQREIGVLRALGMSRRQVRWLVAGEAGLMGLAGALIGAVGGVTISLAFGRIINAFALAVGFAPVAGFSLPWGVVVAALVAGPATAVVAALYPAARAARLEPTEAMRGE